MSDQKTLEIELVLKTKFEDGKVKKNKQKFQCPDCNHIVEYGDDAVIYTRNDFDIIRRLWGNVDNTIVKKIKDYPLVLSILNKLEDLFEEVKDKEDEEYKSNLSLTNKESTMLMTGLEKLLENDVNNRLKVFGYEMQSVSSVYSQVGGD